MNLQWQWQGQDIAWHDMKRAMAITEASPPHGDHRGDQRQGGKGVRWNGMK